MQGGGIEDTFGAIQKQMFNWNGQFLRSKKLLDRQRQKDRQIDVQLERDREREKERERETERERERDLWSWDLKLRYELFRQIAEERESC